MNIAQDDAVCKKCKLNKLPGANKIFTPVYGRPIMIVGQSPSQEENDEADFLVTASPSGKFMWQALETVGITRDDCDVTAALRCIPAEPVIGSYSSYLRPRSPSKEEIKSCSVYTKSLVQLAITPVSKQGSELTVVGDENEEVVTPEIGTGTRAILILGQVAAKQLLGGEFKKDRRIIDSAKLGVRVFCVDHPGFFLRSGIRGLNEDDERLKAFRQTIKAMAEFVGSGATTMNAEEYLKQQVYRLVKTEEKAWRFVRKLKKWAIEKNERLSVDVEDDVPDDLAETGVESGERVVLTIAICPKAGYSVMFVVDHPDAIKSERDGIVKALHWLLSDPQVKLTKHYGATDAEKLNDILHIPTPGYNFDTFTGMYMAFPGSNSYGLAALVDSHAPQFSGYKNMIAPYVGPPGPWPKAASRSNETLYNFIKKKSTMHFSQIPLGVLRLYNNADADVGKRFEKIAAPAAPAALQALYTDMGHIVMRMERNGPLVDYRHIEVLKKLWPPQVKKAAQRLKDIAEDPEFNPNTPADVAWLLWEKLAIPYPDPKAKTKSTGKEILLQVASDYPIAGEVMAYRKIAKTMSTYITGYEYCANVNGGKLRTKWWLCSKAGTLVLTDKGQIPIEDVKIGALVLSHTGRACRVYDSFDNGKRQLYKITLANGMTLSTTGNHPYRINSNWVRASQLKVGMFATVYGKAERWKRIPYVLNHQASSWGRVRHTATKRVKSLGNSGRSGHLRVTLNGKSFLVSRLVADTFIAANGKPFVLHRNGHAWDNSLHNLVRGTQDENYADAVVHGVTHKRKLTNDDVIAIRSIPQRYGVQTRLAAQYGVSRETIKDIQNNRYRKCTVLGKAAFVDFAQSEIVRIELVGIEQTYGLSVEEDESHVTNGIVTHNTGTRTGRMSSGGSKEKIQGVVNLQNIQKKTEIRNIIVSDHRWRELHLFLKAMIMAGATDKELEESVLEKFGDMDVFLEFDQGQVEVRVAAQLSGDRQMITDCEAGDIHSQVGHAMTGWAIEKIKNDKDTRTRTKNVHFGILFGLKPDGILKYIKGFDPNTKITLQDVEGYYANYFNRYPGMQVFIDKQHIFAEINGYVETIFGMKRPLIINEHLKGLVDDYGQPAYWKNIAVNTPVQGSAHQLLMCGIVALWRKPEKYAILGIPQMEVHDNLVMRVKLRDLVDSYWLAKELLEQEPLRTVKQEFPHIDWRVKLEVDGAAGFRFGVKAGLNNKLTVAKFLRDWYAENEKSIDAIKVMKAAALAEAA